MKGCGAGGWASVAVAPIPPEVCLIFTDFYLFEGLAIVARVAHFAQIFREHHKQASANVKLGFSASDVAEATKKVVEATHSARQPELFLEVRACVDRALPWCDKVRSKRVVEPSRAKKAGARMLQMRRLRRFFFAHKTFRSTPLFSLSSLFTSQHPTRQGFPVAHVQLPLPVQAAPSTSPSAPVAAGGALEASNFSGGITIKGDGVEVEVCFFLSSNAEEHPPSSRTTFSTFRVPLFRSFSRQLIVLCMLLRKHYLTRPF